MYIIDRLKNIICVSDPDSSDFILASFFLDPASFTAGKITLSTVEKQTFISMSAVSRFIKDCGAANLKSFVSDLRAEFDEMGILSQRRMWSAPLPARMAESAEEAARAVCSSKRVLFYGNTDDINLLNGFMNACILTGRLPVVLSAWQIAKVRRLLESVSENDCLFLADSDYSLPMLKLRMDLEEEVPAFHELEDLPLKKIFVGKDSASQSDSFIRIPLPAGEETVSALLSLSAYLSRRIKDI